MCNAAKNRRPVRGISRVDTPVVRAVADAPDEALADGRAAVVAGEGDDAGTSTS
jgi:hypothetical protein